ncbi:MAG: hypothetical protein OEZ06_10465 [Myxococcales bacterium]|nr:hypothetical protein [Myxococcales bacterium]
MFESAARVEPRFEDARGRAVALRDYLPRHAYLTDFKQVERIAAFVCQREPERAPFRLWRAEGEVVVLLPGSCLNARPR